MEELKKELDCSGVPDEFLCPITRELMRDPVIAAGQERSALSTDLGDSTCVLGLLLLLILWMLSFQTDTPMKEKL